MILARPSAHQPNAEKQLVLVACLRGYVFLRFLAFGVCQQWREKYSPLAFPGLIFLFARVQPYDGVLADFLIADLNFLGQQIFARKGIAFLSHAANIPIVTVASYRTSWNNIRLQFFDPIFPDADKERGLFAEETTQKMYDLVAPIVKQYPEQWEAWLYIHKVANIINPDRSQPNKRVSLGTEKITLDSFRFGIFKLAGTSFLLKKNSYSFYEINNKLYDFLAKCTNEPVKKDCIDYTLFNQLYEQGVIQYV